MFPSPLFRDRVEAGAILGRRLGGEIEDSGVVVLALPRGGVPVGFEIAHALHAELDVFLVRKLGAPGREELAMGAIASGGIRVLNEDIIRELRIPNEAVERATAREREEIARRERLYREGRPAAAIEGRTAVLVDDGLATGATMLAAARAVRLRSPRRLVVAVPVASPQACEDFREQVDQVFCLTTPQPFYAVGAWYEDFAQTTDAEVRELLERAAHERVGRGGTA
ncbi:MAG: phosphoribosyltransferase [Acidobacteriia bacterium]|nr:phosphoribosyltransferase [Terriglobia bacterium]